MFFKKLSLKSITPSCLKAKHLSLEPKPKGECPKKTSRRISLSDLSDTSKLCIVGDLSNSVLGSNLHTFSLKELKDITQSFSKSNFLGEGGFGRVYKGFIDDKLRHGLEAQLVAVKVLDLDGKQGHREWLAEVIFLGQLKHPHLVNLIGCCCEDEQRLLVYEYMDRGNLDSKLFSDYTATLPWLTRLKIAIGAAKGLGFLHEEEKPVIYRDVKPSNILLDTDYNAKLSDFGLATDGPEGEESHVSTKVVGTHGYAAPEYIMTGHLTTMSDVFSFGIVLLEMLTGRRSVEKNRPTREQNLVEWARPMLKDPRKLDRIIDPRLEGKYSTEAARKAALVAHQCLSRHPKSRPSMTTVVKTLEPLVDLNEIPVGHFVYVFPTDDAKQNSVVIVNEKNDHKESDDVLRKKITSEEHKDRGDNNKVKGRRRRQRKSQISH